MEQVLEGIKIRKQKFEEANFFEGVLFCMWANKAVNEGGDHANALSRSIFYGWV